MIGAILGTAASVAGSVYGAIKSSQANKRAQALIQSQKDENKRWYDQKMAEDYTQRSDAQNVLRKQRELFREQYQKAKASNVVSGGTDESLALQQAQANATMGDTMGNIAAQASNYKDSIEQQYRNQDAALTQQQAQTEQAKGNAIAQAAGQVSSAAGGLIQGGLDRVKPKINTAALALDPDAVANEILANEELNKVQA